MDKMSETKIKKDKMYKEEFKMIKEKTKMDRTSKMSKIPKANS